MQGERGLEREVMASYPERCGRFVERVRDKICGFAAQGTVGVYCAPRALALLDRTQSFRFFDDDPAQQGKFLSPFQTQITGRESLLSAPVDHLVIMSRTFGQRILDNLRQQGFRGSIVSLDEM